MGARFEIHKTDGIDLKIEAFEEGLQFAKSELIRYINKVCQTSGEYKTGEKTIVLTTDAKVIAKSGICLQYDGFALITQKDQLVIISNYARGVLFGVYEFLRSNGCCFVKAAGISEIIPERDELHYENTQVFNPDFELRSLTNMGTTITDEWAEQTVDFVDWCAKNYLNGVFLHETLEDCKKEANKRVIAEIKKRDMTFEFGGHGGNEMVDKGLFESKPELFIEKEGKRSAEGNFCVSNSESIEIFIKNVESYLEENKDIDILHFWFEDAVKGSWCECKVCKNLSAAKQQLKLVKLISKLLSKKFPKIKIDMLLYHDTLDDIKNLKVQEKNILGFYAPRERCYAHALDDQTCDCNRIYMQKLKDAVNVFGQDHIHVFEYYMDYILFSKNKANFAQTIAEDLKAYLSVGVKQMCPLSFGLYSFWAYDINMVVYAKHSFNTNLNYRDTVRDYCKQIGFSDQEFMDYVELTEKYSKSYFSVCGYEGAYADIRKLPLCDYMKVHIENVKQALGFMAEAETLLDLLRQRYPSSDYLQYEKEILTITIKESRGIYRRMTLRYLNYKKKITDKEQAIVELEEIKKGLYEIINIADKIPQKIKGVQGEKTFVEHLCKDQIWTVNEILSEEFGIPVDMNRAII